MKDILRPVLELLVVLPGLLLGYFPVKTYLKQSPGRLAAWLFPLMACLCIGSGLACYRLGASTFLALAGVALAAICLYTRTLTISLWKSGTIALSVCAVFACVNSLSRAVSAAIIAGPMMKRYSLRAMVSRRWVATSLVSIARLTKIRGR